MEAKFDDSGVCTPEELEEAVFQLRLSLAEFEEKETGAVEEYDRVTLSFQVILEGVELSEKGAEELEIVVGLDGYDGEKAALAQALIGAQVGEGRWADYRYPESVLQGSLAGKTVVAKGVVKKIERPVLPTVDEAFVQQMKGFEKASVEEFYQAVEQDVIDAKNEAKITAVWAAFCDGVTVHAYPEEELGAYRDAHFSYYSSLAEAMEMELDAFLEEYMNVSRERLEEEMQAYAEEMVKNDMIFLQLIRTLTVQLTEEEYWEGLERYREAEGDRFESAEAFEKYYGREQILENLTRDKALLLVVDEAICTE